MRVQNLAQRGSPAVEETPGNDLPMIDGRSHPAGWPGLVRRMRSHRRTAEMLVAVFFVTLFVFLYCGYPFDGMVASDSWFLYRTDVESVRTTAVRLTTKQHQLLVCG